MTELTPAEIAQQTAERRGECNHGRPLLSCPCGTPDCYTCDARDAVTLTQRIADLIRGVQCRYDRGQDHVDEPKRCSDGVFQALAELVVDETERERGARSRAEIQRDNACEKFAQIAGRELDEEELYHDR